MDMIGGHALYITVIQLTFHTVCLYFLGLASPKFVKYKTWVCEPRRLVRCVTPNSLNTELGQLDDLIKSGYLMRIDQVDSVISNRILDKKPLGQRDVGLIKWVVLDGFDVRLNNWLDYLMDCAANSLSRGSECQLDQSDVQHTKVNTRMYLTLRQVRLDEVVEKLVK